MFCPRCFATFCDRRLVNWGQNGGEAHETQRTDRIVGAVAALCLCTALVLPPGSPWLHEPALLYPGLSLAAVVPAAWAVWWVVVPPQPLPPEQLLEPVQRQSLAALCGT